MLVRLAVDHPGYLSSPLITPPKLQSSMPRRGWMSSLEPSMCLRPTQLQAPQACAILLPAGLGVPLKRSGTKRFSCRALEGFSGSRSVHAGTARP
jgi:hypothetical protein